MSISKESEFAGTLIDGARMYAASADAVNEKYPNALHVLNHLLGMSTELALKAYLVNNSVTKKELRRLGHDLTALYEKAKELGITDTGSRTFRLSVLGANYKPRIFAYPETGNLTVIQPRSLREINREILCEVFKAVKGYELSIKMQNEPGLAILSTYADDLDSSAWAQ
ncbi:MAG: hypothetical protein LAT77_06570 [Aliidiomarina sp.]|uniref:hypothetical protein n=1 Tax=Aliidiomarina sp. TaxID=1872439 RepID=UPI0025BAA2CD|nr:hypothetical protein [Aliidiomarina sp.]MCH8501559.1 hypothetical protein [Aliidiomarina sp.]